MQGLHHQLRVALGAKPQSEISGLSSVVRDEAIGDEGPVARKVGMVVGVAGGVAMGGESGVADHDLDPPPLQ